MLTHKEKVELLRESVASENNRQAHAGSWATIIEEKLPVLSTVRKIYTVDQIEPGTAPTYQLDVPYLSAWVMPRMGAVPTNLVQLEEVTINTYEMVGDVEYKIRDAEQGRLNVIERAQQRLTDSIVQKEETDGWSTLTAAVTSGNTISVSGESGLTKLVINTAFQKMESRRDYKVTEIFVSPNRYANIRNWTSTTIDPVTQREIYVDAGLNSIWQANINIAYNLTDSEAYFIDTRPNLLGFMPVRGGFRTYDDPTCIKKLRVGIIAHQEVGFGITDANRIVKATISD